MNAESRPGRGSERCPVSASISVLLRSDARSNGLILVRIDNQWGLPAGGLAESEYLVDGIRAEIREETGISRGNILFDPFTSSGIPSQFVGAGEVLPRHVVCPSGGDRIQIGIVFQAAYRGPKLDKNGWPVYADRVDYAKPFSMRNLLVLVEKHVRAEERGASGEIYKSHFNFPLFMTWIDRTSVRAYKHPAYVNRWALRMKDRIPGLELIENSPFTGSSERQWRYYSPSLYGEQNPVALKRAGGQRWGP